MKRLLYILSAIMLFSCSEDMADTESLGENAGIIGTWVEVPDMSMAPIDDGITRFKRMPEIDPENYGFIIMEDGTFIENKNAGWCGTPPISYASYEGTWVAVSDSLLDITVGYWGGTMTYQIRIVFVDEEDLAVKYFFEDERVDSR